MSFLIQYDSLTTITHTSIYLILSFKLFQIVKKDLKDNDKEQRKTMHSKDILCHIENNTVLHISTLI